MTPSDQQNGDTRNSSIGIVIAIIAAVVILPVVVVVFGGLALFGLKPQAQVSATTYAPEPTVTADVVALSKSEKCLASWNMSGAAVRVWDVATTTPLFTLPETGYTSDVAFSDDDAYLVTWDNQLTGKRGEVWDAKTGTNLVTIPYLQPKIIMRARSYFPEELTNKAKKITPPLKLQFPKDGVARFSCGAFSPDDSLMATVHEDRKLYLWDLKTGARLFTTEVASVSDTYTQSFHLAFSDSGRWLVSMRTTACQIWRVYDAEDNVSPTPGLSFSPHRMGREATASTGERFAVSDDDSGKIHRYPAEAE